MFILMVTMRRNELEQFVKVTVSKARDNIAPQ